MADTREKLLEAKYFLERMKEKKSDRDAFKYNLSAFLSAARSVTFVMQNEFDKVPGFKEWYTEKQAKMQSDESKLLNDKRVMTIHIQLVQPHAHVMVTVEERISISDSVSVTIIRADSTIERGESEPMPPPAPTKTNTTTEWKWYFDELPNKDVVTVCEEHIVKLETLVAEYESRFTSR